MTETSTMQYRAQRVEQETPGEWGVVLDSEDCTVVPPVYLRVAQRIAYALNTAPAPMIEDGDAAGWAKVDKHLHAQSKPVAEMEVNWDSATFKPEGLYVEATTSLFVPVEVYL